MSAMKKDYVKPRMVAVDLDGCEDLLQSSYVDVGGTTNRFNVRGRSHGLWDDLEEE